VSFQATKFVIGLHGLNPSQKAVAHAFAYHADKDGMNSYPAMERVARESGFQSKRGAQKIVRQLEEMGVITAETAKTGGRGRDKATVYRLNLKYAAGQKDEPQFTVSDDERVNAGSSFSDSPGVNSATQKGEQGDRKGRTPVHTNSQEQSKKSECSKNTHTLDSQKGRVEKKQSGSQPNPGLPHSFPPTEAIYGTAEWLNERLDEMPPEDRVAAEISAIELEGGRRFTVNRQTKGIITKWVAKGAGAEVICGAARQIASTLSPKDTLPDLTLADGLDAAIVLQEQRRLKDAQQQEAREEKREQERREAEMLDQIKLDEKAAGEQRETGSVDPDAFYRFDLQGRVDDARRQCSLNFPNLFHELEGLRSAAVAARLQPSHLATVDDGIEFDPATL
jgi:hypothetical protein